MSNLVAHIGIRVVLISVLGTIIEKEKRRNYRKLNLII